MQEDKLNRDINLWFEKNYNEYLTQVSKNICYGQMQEYSSEVCVECYLSFIKQAYEKKLQYYQDKKIMGYLLACASLNIRSSTSPFYFKYRKKKLLNTSLEFSHDPAHNPFDEFDEIEMYRNCLQSYLDKKADWYEKELIRLKFFEGKHFKEIAKEYGMPIGSLLKDVKTVLWRLRSYCKDKNSK